MDDKTHLPKEYENKFCKFIFKDGTVKQGIYSAFFPSEPGAYYFVRLIDLIEFKAAMDAGDHNTMKKFCTTMPMTDLLMVEFIK